MRFAFCVTVLLAGFVSAPLPLHAQDGGLPAGSWKTTNGCFLAEFVLAKDGAYLAYDSGEEEEGGTWNWDGKILTISSSQYNKDSFEGRVTGDRIDAHFVWHDADTDTLHPQNCIFQRMVAPKR